MIKSIAVGAIVVVALVLTKAAMQPDVVRIHRTANIDAPPAKIFPLINDLHAFNSWNPFNAKDPNLKGTYSRTTAGKGAAYAFEGNRDVGRGEIEITDLTQDARVIMRLTMLEPMKADNTVEFNLVPAADRTMVTWSLETRPPLVAKVFHLFVDVDRMVGGEFEKGLATLKTRVERAG